MTTPTTTPNSQNELHVVLGGGQIGDRLTNLLAASGKHVRSVQRSARSESNPRITRVSGDITDHAFAEQAIAGASVVYDTMNPQYHQWPELLLPIARGALHGAQRAGAKLVALDCLYMYGRPSGSMREDSPRNPCSKKGALRVELEQLRMEYHRRGDVAVAIGRASDFFGANLANAVFSPRFFKRLLAGQAVEVLGDSELLHSYSYAEDVAQAMATLGAHDVSFGRVWHMPTPPAETTRALCERFARELERPLKIRTAPQFVWNLGGLFVPFMREVAEMNYQWQVPYVIDDRLFRETFGASHTPIEQAARETAEWARQRFARNRLAAHRNQVAARSNVRA